MEVYYYYKPNPFKIYQSVLLILGHYDIVSDTSATPALGVFLSFGNQQVNFTTKWGQKYIAHFIIGVYPYNICFWIQQEFWLKRRPIISVHKDEGQHYASFELLRRFMAYTESFDFIKTYVAVCVV